MSPEESALQASTSSFEHRVRTSERGWGDGEAHGLRGLQIDHQLIPRWRLYGQIAGFVTLQNSAYVARLRAETFVLPVSRGMGLQ